MTTGTSARIAKLLRGGATLRATAEQTGANVYTVIKVRDTLKIKRPPRGPNPPNLAELLDARTTPGDDGHLLWTGHRGHAGLPLAYFEGKQTSALRLMWLAHTDDWPPRKLRVTCTEPTCVAFEHLALRDAPMPLTQVTASLDHIRYLLAQRCEPVNGGHLRWIGPMRGNIPTMRVGQHPSRQAPAASWMWLVHTGHEPEGPVRATCDYRACMAIEHLTCTNPTQ